MTAAELRSLGEALYGMRWKAALARALGVSESSVRDWARGRDRVPPARVVAIRAVAAQRMAKIVAELDRGDQD